MPFQLPENKIARLFINVLLIAGWFFIYAYINHLLLPSNVTWGLFLTSISIGGINFVPILLLLIPIFFITRYIWFKESRNRIFYGLFDNFKKYQPRLYTTSSNADELKKYSDLKDQGIITEEEFQAKKRKLLDL